MGLKFQLRHSTLAKTPESRERVRRQSGVVEWQRIRPNTLDAGTRPPGSTCGPSIASNPEMLTVKHQRQNTPNDVD